MSQQISTPYSRKCSILANLWLNYRNEEEFVDFIEYNDLGLPLAYLLSEDIVKTTTKAQQIIDETWSLLLSGLGIEEDTGFEDLRDVLEAS